ncbi:hypothetical protein X975_12322, partial [Stegodyphus mimosarum]
AGYSGVSPRLFVLRLKLKKLVYTEGSATNINPDSDTKSYLYRIPLEIPKVKITRDKLTELAFKLIIIIQKRLETVSSVTFLNTGA